MVRRTALLAAVAAALALVVSASAEEKKAAPKEAPKNAAFEQLKKLSGKWSGKGDCMGTTMEFTVTYKVTSAGSAVMETIAAGTDHEMISMYTLDGERLIMTHYCALGNQPRMRAEKTDDPKKLAFKFLDGTNLDAGKDMHMHEGSIEWVDDNHIKSEWVAYDKGKPIGASKIELKRQKGN
jgi:hypothetical protein